MPGWFRQGPSPHRTALAMIGAKAGDRVLIAGSDDPDLAAEVARITGLNGQTTVCDDTPSAGARVEAAAANAGVLLEFVDAPVTRLPVKENAFDIVVAVRLASLGDAARLDLMASAMRALHSGGRVIAIEGVKQSRLQALLGRDVERMLSADMLALLDRAGARARRQLAEVEGVAYYEGRKG